MNTSRCVSVVGLHCVCLVKGPAVWNTRCDPSKAFVSSTAQAPLEHHRRRASPLPVSGRGQSPKNPIPGQARMIGQTEHSQNTNYVFSSATEDDA